MNTFMVKVVLKNSELSGYMWSDTKNAHMNGYVEVVASTLKRAIERVEVSYGDRDKYWIKADESYIILK